MMALQFQDDFGVTENKSVINYLFEIYCVFHSINKVFEVKCPIPKI